jgi:hypothetical protein
VVPFIVDWKVVLFFNIYIYIYLIFKHRNSFALLVITYRLDTAESELITLLVSEAMEVTVQV